MTVPIFLCIDRLTADGTSFTSPFVANFPVFAVRIDRRVMGMFLPQKKVSHVDEQEETTCGLDARS